MLYIPSYFDLDLNSWASSTKNQSMSASRELRYRFRLDGMLA
jgi:hypothetical protein